MILTWVVKLSPSQPIVLLTFRGGSIINGTIIGNNTIISPVGYKVSNVELQGTFKYFDGVNAISSEGLCLNNTYDVLDVNNLSKEVISDYQIVDSNYSILPQFRNIRSVRLATGQFAGFPTSVINNNVLYCFYYQAATQDSTTTFDYTIASSAAIKNAYKVLLIDIDTSTLTASGTYYQRYTTTQPVTGFTMNKTSSAGKTFTNTTNKYL